jgi:hypothetical protein
MEAQYQEVVIEREMDIASVSLFCIYVAVLVFPKAKMSKGNQRVEVIVVKENAYVYIYYC